MRRICSFVPAEPRGGLDAKQAAAAAREAQSAPAMPAVMAMPARPRWHASRSRSAS